MVYALEHRFFGESWPFDDSSVDHLSYLTADQALFDLAHFVEAKRDELLAASGAEDVAFLILGGSYPGALSAWFRAKFPHLSVGAVASSAVVNPVIDFTIFDRQVRESLQPACAGQVDRINDLVATDMDGFRARWNSPLANDYDFAYWLADAFVGPVQYAYKADLCTADLLAAETDEDLLAAFDAYLAADGKLEDTAEYDSALLSRLDNDNSRSWLWMKCTGLAYFQDADPRGSPAPRCPPARRGPRPLRCGVRSRPQSHRRHPVRQQRRHSRALRLHCGSRGSPRIRQRFPGSLAVGRRSPRGF
eukprot:gnl/Ergobibamus_cyprinoides/864.p1 GENE.gnl/Ergobibamus_cyprinoides/864~~gnl/Ergobibamus_cyprinoides/864.p1  ORF type:complete len:352 (+),score=93.32 gnl/Ergobibamus_cyprinoides/864:143-1057(+)